MTQLIYPTLDLFIYDIRRSLGQNDDKIDENRNNFFSKIYTKLDEKTLEAIKCKENDTAEYVLFDPVPFEAEEDGNYYALQINDIYALKINYSGQKSAENTPQDIESIARYKQFILNKINHNDHPEIDPDKKGTIGETWLLWGKLTDNEVDPQTIAQECYQKIAPQNLNKPKLSEAEELFGGKIWEIWQHPSLTEQYHLIIWLFPPEIDLNDIQQKILKIYYDLIRLLGYRHKILWAYQQSQKLKQDLTQKYTKTYQSLAEINSIIQNKQYNLAYLRTQLGSILTTISDYTNQLSRLNAQKLTLQTNLENYRKRLQTLTKKDQKSDLNILTNFSEYATEKYQQEIEIAYAYFSPGINLLDNQIKLIEGVINIEQTQSDRNLAEIVGIASVGVGVGAIAATVIVTNPPENITLSNYYLTKGGISIFLGFFAALLIYVWQKLLNYFLLKTRH